MFRTPLKIILVVLCCSVGLLATGTPAHAANGCGSDGTEWVPDGFAGADFGPACNRHDDCYASSSSTDRKDCDEALKDGLDAACKDEFAWYNPTREVCLEAAYGYYLAVRQWGDGPYAGSGDPS